MQATLLDEEGMVLTEITSHAGRSPGQVLVDWATRPDVLFQYYFDRGGSSVTMVRDAEQYSAVLGTRWQMGARFWFLHTLHRLRTAPHVRVPRDAELIMAGVERPREHANVAERAPSVATAAQPPGVPA